MQISKRGRKKSGLFILSLEHEKSYISEGRWAMIRATSRNYSHSYPEIRSIISALKKEELA